MTDEELKTFGDLYRTVGPIAETAARKHPSHEFATNVVSLLAGIGATLIKNWQIEIDGQVIDEDDFAEIARSVYRRTVLGEGLALSAVHDFLDGWKPNTKRRRRRSRGGGPRREG